MEDQIDDQSDPVNDVGEGSPVCIKCFRPVDPFAHYCSHCGGATGNFTHYLPFTNLRWQVDVWVQTWHQIGYKEVSIPGRLIRLLMILWQMPIMLPIMLLGLLFRSKNEVEKEQCQQGNSSES